MADDAPQGKGPRVVVHISPEMQFLLTQVAARMLWNKKTLHEHIWEAGVKNFLGIDEDQIQNATVTSLPRSVAATPDARRLVQMMLKP